MSAASVFAGVFVALYVAHELGDHWVQSPRDAELKAKPGIDGALAAARHVTSYTATGIVAVTGAAWVLGMALSPLACVVGFAISAVTHWIADWRPLFRRIAVAMGQRQYLATVAPGLSGAFHLDQSWHKGWLLISALVIAAGSV